MERFNKLLFLLTVLFISARSLFALETLPGNGEVAVYPENPASTDSLYLVYTYVSTDGCPDYFLRLDSVAPGIIKVSLQSIPDSGRFCTMVVMKFKVSMNLGVIRESTAIYLNNMLIKTVEPGCVPDRIGKVIATTNNSSLIQEDSTGYVFQLNNLILKQGTVVKFNGTIIMCFMAPCYNIVNCFRIIDTPPACIQNRKGIIVEGKDDCAGQLLIREYSPISSALQNWRISSLDKTIYKPGELVIFGGEKVIPDPSESFYCRIVGNAFCITRIEENPSVVWLNVKAWADSALVQYGYAVLYKKGIRKAVASTIIRDGLISFKGIKDDSYTVFVVPDRKLYPGYLPTYYINKLFWKQADYVTLSDSMQQIQIMLKKHPRIIGTGKIGGCVHYEYTNLKDSAMVVNGVYTEKAEIADGTACNIPVILFNDRSEAVAWTVTDQNGNYIFENVLPGIYTVLAETSTVTAETSVSLQDEINQPVVDILLKSAEQNTEIRQLDEDLLGFFPNPVSNQCWFNVAVSGKLNLMTLNGQLIKSEWLSSGTNQLNLTDIPKGLYLLRFGNSSSKLMKE